MIRPCLSGSSSEALAKKTRLLALELLLREDVQAALLALGDHYAPSKLFSVLGGQDQPALLVEPGGVSTEEHG